MKTLIPFLPLYLFAGIALILLIRSFAGVFITPKNNNSFATSQDNTDISKNLN